MTGQKERRKSERNPDEALSPELVALLLQCGGAVREADHPTHAESGDSGEKLWDRRRPERRRSTTP